jgi:hypothetical protein
MRQLLWGGAALRHADLLRTGPFVLRRRSDLLRAGGDLRELRAGGPSAVEGIFPRAGGEAPPRASAVAHYNVSGLPR